MKKVLALITVLMLLLSVTACSDGADSTRNEGASKSVSFAELMNAFKSAGYYTEVSSGSSGFTPQFFGIHSATTFSSFNFHKVSGAQEKDGLIFFAEMKSESEAVSVFNEQCQLQREGGVAMKNVSNANGKKAIGTKGDSEFGTKYIFLQVENTFIYASELWDIDGNAVYDDGMAKILEKIGY